MPSIDNSKPQAGYWRSLHEYARSDEFRSLAAGEFPAGADESPDSVSRRGFLKIMGASVALASLAGCRWPRETIVPRAYRPVGLEPGETRAFATAFELGGHAAGLLATSFEGRPIKIEGNPDDPLSLGAATALAQASILELYDPDRSRHPVEREADGEHRRDAAAAEAFLAELRVRHAADGGAGLRVLSEASASPTLDSVRRRFLSAFPRASWHVWEPLNGDAEYAGTAQVFGRPLRAQPDLSRAKVIVTIDADLLAEHPAALALARDFAAGRDPDHAMNRLYCIESRYTVTGSMADHRLPLQGSRMEAFALSLVASLLGKLNGSLPTELRDLRRALDVHQSHRFDESFLSALVDDIVHARGKALLAAGPRQSPLVHALVALANEVLGASGRTVRYTEPAPGEITDQLGSLGELVAAMRGGRVEDLVLLGGNPVYDAPADLDFAGALEQVAHSMHLSLYRNETSRRCAWHVNRAHYLESWGDARSWDGALLSVQPLISPLYGGWTATELLARLADGGAASAHDLVRRTLGESEGLGAEAAWRKLLHDGVLPGSASATVSPSLQPAQLTAAVAGKPANGGYHGLELEFHACSTIHDGRFANNGWLQELPDPASRITWDNAAAMSPATAAELGVKHGDRVSLAVAGRELAAAAAVLPGIARGTVAIALGYGRSAAGSVGDGVGFDAYGLRSSESLHFAAGLELRATGGSYPLAGVQDHYQIDPIGAEGRESRLHKLVREGTVADYEHDHGFARHLDHHPPLLSLWKEHAYEGHRWGMSIDLNTCLGCGACAVACQAENNIPVVGKDQVARGREMSWIRLDRYYAGEPENPTSMVQPVACAQCEMAPCEQVCPFQATTHSSEGLNDMVYNRCVGTRYCANNCPYKVRRFNFYNYNKHVSETEMLGKNPEVTVRSRGVMEKCSYCVQRIQDVKIRAKNEGRPIADGEITTACQQTCPTKAIRFGDLNDEQSDVRAQHGSPRSYTLLQELNLKPRTAYLARVRNPNPRLVSSEHEQQHGHS